MKDIFSAYVPEKKFPVYCHECWYSDSWDPMSYGKDFDFSKPFFAQLGELLNTVPKINLFQLNAQNSPYSNIVMDAKNAYLSYSLTESENIFYSKNIDASRDLFDCLSIKSSEGCLETTLGNKNYNTVYSVLVQSCLNSSFLYDCTNTTDCFMSSNLRNMQYVFRNKQYTKEEYARVLADIDTGSYEVLTSLLQEFREMRLRYPHKYAELTKTVNSTGDYLGVTRDAYRCFEAYDLENVRYTGRSFSMKDSMDVNNIPKGELIYEYVSGGRNDHGLKFCMGSLGNLRDSEYSAWCSSSSNLFGCFGLKSKNYCIFNQQYSEEEYRILIPKIKQHMNEMPYLGRGGRVYQYGEFFPIELSPFPYNDTVAQEYFALSKEDAETKGYSWREPDTRNVVINLKTEELLDHIKDYREDVLTKTIECLHEGTCREQCTGAFRLVPQELALYKKLNLPVPRLCPNCRHYARLKWRNPWKLWKKRCTCQQLGSQAPKYRNTVRHFHGNEPCPNEFETSYAPERQEIVYCETCYQSEVV